MADPPLEFTAVVPSYNHERYVGAAIESALSQEGVAFEVIVVDDGSTDGSRRVIEEFASHPRLRVVLQENRGVSGAFNRGLAEARAPFVGFVCSDDRWEADHLLRARGAFEAGGPRCAFVWGRARVMDDLGAPVPADRFSMFRPPSEGDLFGQLVRGNFIPFIGVVSRTAAVREVGGFDPGLGILQDYDLWLRLLLRGFEGCYHGAETARFRWHGENESGRHARGGIQRRLDRIRILERLMSSGLERIREAGLEGYVHETISQNYARLARRLSDPGEKSARYMDAWRWAGRRVDHLARAFWYRIWAEGS